MVHTHAKVTLGKQCCDFRFSLDKLAEQIGGLFKPECIAKVLHYPGREVIRDDGRYLDLGIRAELPA
jgi:hypothetical protein